MTTDKNRDRHDHLGKGEPFFETRRKVSHYRFQSVIIVPIERSRYHESVETNVAVTESAPETVIKFPEASRALTASTRTYE
jgi:hypothetical protein